MSSNILDKTIGSLNTSLNLRLANQNVISSNIANADTPGYKAKRLDFEQALRSQLASDDRVQLEVSDPEHLVPQESDPIHPEIYEDPNGVESLDGNTVNRSEEMARLVQNQMLYNTSVELLRKKLSMLRSAIQDSGGSR